MEKIKRIVLCTTLAVLLCFVTACGSNDSNNVEGTGSQGSASQGTSSSVRDTSATHSRDETGGVLEEMVDDVGDGMRDAGEDVKDGAENVKNDVEQGVKDVKDGMEGDMTGTSASDGTGSGA